MMTMTKTQATETGIKMGMAAFASGCGRAPALDAAMQPALAPLACTIGDAHRARKARLSKALMTGWLRGWDAANLAAVSL